MYATPLLRKAMGKYGQLAVAIVAMGFGVAAHAHITVSPTQSKLGKKETYTFSVPTEGSVSTTGVEIDVPPEVTILSVEGDPATYTLKKVGDRIVGIAWKVNIPPGAGQQFVVVGQNPSQPTRRLHWKAHQFFADGSQADWVELPPAKPAPLTRLSAEEM